MNDSKPWRKKEETEINLMELFKSLGRQWKQILVCAVVLAALFCAYRFQRDASTTQEQKNAASGEESMELTDDQQRQVDTALILRKKVEAVQEYLDESILMKLDSSHVSQAVLLYSIDDTNPDNREKIAQSYISFVNNGAALKALAEADSEWADQRDYLSELISASVIDKRSELLLEKSSMKEMIFSIQINAEDTETAKKMADVLQAALDEYYVRVRKEIGDHVLTLLDSSQVVKVNRDIESNQQNTISQLSTNQMSLNNMIAGFDENQKKAYEQLSEDGAAGNTSEDSAVAGTKPGISIKWLLFGFVGGIFLYCLVFACWYLLRDTIKNMEELRENFYFPVYGGIRLWKGKKGSGEDLSGRQKDIYEREKAQMLNRIRLACQQQEITEICLATDFSLSEQEKEFMAAVSKQLNEWKIKTVLIENISGNISMWDTMTNVGKLLLVCQINKTTHRMIDEEMAFFHENHLEVLGAVTIEH